MNLQILKTLMLFASCLIFSFCTAQKENEAVDINKVLLSVEEGQILNINAWLINTHRDTVNAREFTGKWTILDFWSVGCRPCIEEFPHLSEWYDQTDTTKFALAGIFVDKKMRRWDKYRKKYNLTFPQYYPGWSVSNQFLALNLKKVVNENGEKAMTTSTPQYVLINPEGMIVKKELPKPSDPNFEVIISKLTQQ